MSARDVLTVYRHELRAYLVSPIPYFFIAVFAMACGVATFLWPTRFFFFARADLSLTLFQWMPYAFLLFVPPLTMRLWCEERMRGTIESLLTLPVASASIVLGKYLAAVTLLLMGLVSTLAIPITASSLGDLDWGATVGGYVGAFLFGAAFMSIGVFTSALTRHQLVALVLTTVVWLLLLLLTEAARDTGTFARVAQALAVLTHYEAMGRGVVDLREVLYFVGICVVFLYMNVRVLENRRHA
jgi:ABC-2 type transport system permease protein